MKIAVIGMGYVGLPLSLQFARTGHEVLGIDSDPAKVEALNAGRGYIKHIAEADIRACVEAGSLSATTDITRVAEVGAVIICLPTPLNAHREPDISYVIDSGRAMGAHLKRGTLVVLESTTYPGTTDEDLRGVLEETSGMKAGVDFHLAYSPEREDPGNPDGTIAKIPKVVGGLTPESLELAAELYSKVAKNVVRVSSCRVAEAAKLLENIFRSVNIALVNELKVVYERMGIDVWEVIEAAKTKPFGYMPFYPGPGLGGHCIPIDPFYLTWKARQYEINTRFIELAGEVNTSMPHHVVGRVQDALNDAGKPLKGSRILLLGLAYKPDVDDARESPSYTLMDLLERKGATVAYNDPFVPEIGMTRNFAHFAGRKSSPLTSDYDLALISTAHSEYRTFDFSSWPIPVVDCRNCVSKRPVNYVRA